MNSDKFQSFWILFMLARNGFDVKMKNFLNIVKLNVKSSIYLT